MRIKLNMFDKKYRIANINGYNGYNPIHEYALNRICHPAYLKVGERGWILFDTEEPFNPVHRLHTSIIKKVEETPGGFLICTENTVYLLEEVTDDAMECI